jgi:hypothetical protein
MLGARAFRDRIATRSRKFVLSASGGRIVWLRVWAECVHVDNAGIANCAIQIQVYQNGQA